MASAPLRMLATAVVAATRGRSAWPTPSSSAPGPNGLAAAIELARNGRSVHVIERASEIGGGTRTAELTLPGFRHDVCSAVHPLAVGSPFLASLPLAQLGLELLEPPIAGGPSARRRQRRRRCDRSLERDRRRARRATAAPTASLVGAFARDWDRLAEFVLGPPGDCRARRCWRRASAPRAACRRPRLLARTRFRTPTARALFAGMAAHAMRPLRAPGTTRVRASCCSRSDTPAAGRSLAAARRRSPRRCARHLESLGRHDRARHARSARWMSCRPPARSSSTSRRVSSSRSAATRCRRATAARWRAFATVPASSRSTTRSRARSRGQRRAARAAGTVHLGGTLEEIAASERAVGPGEPSPRPYVLVAQQSLVDPTRAPAGQHTLWAYCHVPNGSTVDMTGAIERQIERFAPGFGDLVLARATRGTGRSWRPRTPTTSAATSAAAWRACGRCSRARRRD